MNKCLNKIIHHRNYANQRKTTITDQKNTDQDFKSEM